MHAQWMYDQSKNGKHAPDFLQRAYRLRNRIQNWAIFSTPFFGPLLSSARSDNEHWILCSFYGMPHMPRSSFKSGGQT